MLDLHNCTNQYNFWRKIPSYKSLDVEIAAQHSKILQATRERKCVKWSSVGVCSGLMIVVLCPRHSLQCLGAAAAFPAWPQLSCEQSPCARSL